MTKKNGKNVRWREEWREQCRRQLARSVKERQLYGFVRTYKPVLDDAPFRVFNSTAEYRAWCEANLPRYLGYHRAGPKLARTK